MSVKEEIKEFIKRSSRVELSAKKGGAHKTAYIFELRRLSFKEAEEIEETIVGAWDESLGPRLRMRLATQEELEEFVQKTNEGFRGCYIKKDEVFTDCRVFLALRRGNEINLFIKPDGDIPGISATWRDMFADELVKATAVFVLTDDEEDLFPMCDFYEG